MMTRVPKYQSVYNDLMGKISCGIYPLGSLLPPESKLEEMYDVSRVTIRRAISMLASSGYISVQQGSGTKVISSHSISASMPFHKFHNVKEISDSLHDRSQEHIVEVIALDRIQPEKEVSEALGVPQTDFVYRLLRVISKDSVPFGIVTTYLRSDPLPGLDRHKGEFFDLYAFMEKKYNLFFESGDEYISATAATSFEAPFLQVAPGVPLLCFRRISTFTNCGKMEYLITKLRPDIYHLRIHMEGPPVSF